MQEMIELSKMQSQQSETKPQSVVFTKPGSDPPQEVTLLAGPAHFSPELRGSNEISGKVIFANPISACSDFINEDKLNGKIVIVNRGSCMFVEKVSNIFFTFWNFSNIQLMTDSRIGGFKFFA